MRCFALHATVRVLTLSIAVVSCAAAAAAAFPALDRPAVQVRSPERSVLLSATLAGKRIVAVGERGVVALSDDFARHWRQARSVPVEVTLTAVRFVDERNGWAVGHGGVILRSEDGGETWARQADGRTLAQAAFRDAQARANATPKDADAARRLKAAQQLLDDGPDKPLLDLYFSNAQHGYVVGSYNLFFETEDGGRTWTSAMERLDNPKALHLYTVRAQGPQMFIAGEQGQLHRSSDGGRSFAALPSPYAGSWFGMALTERSVVVAGLRGNAFRSTDRGQSWKRIESPASASFLDAGALPGEGVLLLNQAGQVLISRDGTTLSDSGLPPLPQPAQLLPLPDGGLLAVGLAGAMRLQGLRSKAGVPQ